MLQLNKTIINKDILVNNVISQLEIIQNNLTETIKVQTTITKHQPIINIHEMDKTINIMFRNNERNESFSKHNRGLKRLLSVT